jgi:hypothetical protein
MGSPIKSNALVPVSYAKETARMTASGVTVHHKLLGALSKFLFGAERQPELAWLMHVHLCTWDSRSSQPTLLACDAAAAAKIPLDRMEAAIAWCVERGFTPRIDAADRYRVDYTAVERAAVVGL